MQAWRHRRDVLRFRGQSLIDTRASARKLNLARPRCTFYHSSSLLSRIKPSYLHAFALFYTNATASSSAGSPARPNESIQFDLTHLLLSPCPRPLLFNMADRLTQLQDCLDDVCCKDSTKKKLNSQATLASHPNVRLTSLYSNSPRICCH